MIEHQTHDTIPRGTITRNDNAIDHADDARGNDTRRDRRAAPQLCAAFYARVSSEQQANAGTIASQITLLEERIAHDGLVLEPSMRFVDDGYGGATLIRPALEHLRDAIATDVIDRLYVTCPDRLARKCALQMLLCEEFDHYGTQVVFLNRAIGQSPEDALLLQVQGVVAEYERAKINERCRRGRIHAARRGSVGVLGNAPYGYRLVKKSHSGGEALFNVHLEEAQVVKQIFHWIGVERQTLSQACQNLEKQGVLNTHGRVRWSPGTVLGMLRNPAYKGQAAFGKRRQGPMRPRLRPRKGVPAQPRRPHGCYAVPKEQWLTIPVPAIVEEELFDAAARQLEESRKRRRQRRTGARYLLQGLVVCAGCGYAYSASTCIDRGRERDRAHQYDDARKYNQMHEQGDVPEPDAARDLKRAYYRCAPAQLADLPARCHKGVLRADRLEALVWADVRALLQDKDRIRQEFAQRLEANDQDQEPPELRRLQTSIAQLRKSIARLIDLYQDGLLEKADFETRLTAARTRLAAAEARLKSQADAQACAREMRLVIDNLQTFAQQVQAGLADADWETKRQLICTLIKRIEINKEEVRVVYKFDLHPFDSGPNRGLLRDCTRLQNVMNCYNKRV